MPKINKMWLKLKGFQYDTPLDLDMGYYNIRITKDTSNLCKIIIPWGKYHYKGYPMVVCNSPDIFLQKINKLFQGFQFIHAYKDDILILTKGYYTDHVHKLELTLNKLKESGLTYDTEKYFFGKT